MISVLPSGRFAFYICIQCPHALRLMQCSCLSRSMSSFCLSFSTAQFSLTLFRPLYSLSKSETDFCVCMADLHYYCPAKSVYTVGVTEISAATEILEQKHFCMTVTYQPLGWCLQLLYYRRILTGEFTWCKYGRGQTGIVPEGYSCSVPSLLTLS